MKKALLLTLCVCICFVFTLVGFAKTEATVMKIGTANARARSMSQGLFEFAKLVEKYSNGSLKCEVYTDAVIGDDKRLCEGMQIGSVQAVAASVGAVAPFYKEIGVFSLPYLFKDRAGAYKVLDGKIGGKLLDGLSKSGIIGLVYMENGIRHLTNNTREVTTLDDMKGLKIRTMESQIQVDIWRALGANATPMSWSQVYTALEQKVIDGQENPMGNVTSNKLNEVQKYLTLTGHVYDPSVLMVSKVWWDKLSRKDKNAIKKAAVEARDWQRKAAIEEDNTAIKELTSKGMIISELKAGEKEKMRAALQSVYAKYKEQYTPGLVDEILNAK